MTRAGDDRPQNASDATHAGSFTSVPGQLPRYPSPSVRAASSRMGVAPLSISRLTATSPLHGITLDADLCEIDWPEGCFDEARFVPNRWWTVDLEGAEEALAKLPPGPREERHPGLVRWTFNGDELDTGEAARCFQRMAAALSQSGSPYR